MTKSAGDESARVTVTALDRAREVAPTPELEPPTPAEESTVRDSRYGFSVWTTRLGVLVDGAIALTVGFLRGAPSRDGGAGVMGWVGLAVVFASALLLEHVLMLKLPAIMHGQLISPAASLAMVLPIRLGLPVRREFEIDVPAPTPEAPAWPWPVPEQAPSPVEVPKPEPVGVPA